VEELLNKKLAVLFLHTGTQRKIVSIKQHDFSAFNSVESSIVQWDGRAVTTSLTKE
jgi:hypothetical protein